MSGKKKSGLQLGTELVLNGPNQPGTLKWAVFNSDKIRISELFPTCSAAITALIDAEIKHSVGKSRGNST